MQNLMQEQWIGNQFIKVANPPGILKPSDVQASM
jgi:hypothetical protein